MPDALIYMFIPNARAQEFRVHFCENFNVCTHADTAVQAHILLVRLKKQRNPKYGKNCIYSRVAPLRACKVDPQMPRSCCFGRPLRSVNAVLFIHYNCERVVTRQKKTFIYPGHSQGSCAVYTTNKNILNRFKFMMQLC